MVTYTLVDSRTWHGVVRVLARHPVEHGHEDVVELPLHLREGGHVGHVVRRERDRGAERVREHLAWNRHEAQQDV